MTPYFLNRRQVLAKLTAKNQLTLPKSVTQPLGPVQYFEVHTQAGQIILTPVRIQRGDALRAKLAELEINAKTIETALSWSGKGKGATASEKKPVATKRAKTATPRNVPVTGKPVAKPLSQATAGLRKTAAKPSSETAQKSGVVKRGSSTRPVPAKAVKASQAAKSTALAKAAKTPKAGKTVKAVKAVKAVKG